MTITTKQLHEALLLASPKKSPIPILAAVRITKHHVYATTFGVFLRVPYAGGPEAVVDAYVLTECNGKRDIAFSSGGSSVILDGFDPDDFPNPVPFRPEVETTIEQLGELTRLDLSDIMTASAFVSDDVLRPAMAGVYVGKHIVGTCGHRLFWTETPTMLKRPIILRADALKIMRVIGVDSPWTVDIVSATGGGSYLRATHTPTGAMVAQHLVDEPFPNYQRVIPDGTIRTVRANRKQFAAAVKACIPFCKRPRKVRVSFNGTATVEALSSDTDGKFSKDISDYSLYSLSGPSTVMGFNADYLIDVLAASKSETVYIAMNGPTQAATFDGQVLLMPVRLDN
jgi:DNA polymerase-3 subunit beta